jgi:hypothetical protein
MTSVKKLDDEFKKSKEPNNLFFFEINDEDDDHVKLCQFISHKTRKWNLKTYTTSERVSRLSGADLHDKTTGEQK